jgi:hypothetical protein
MTHARQMIAAHPVQPAVEADLLGRCLDDCYDCAQTCTACADACLAEQELPTLLRAIRLCLDCADVCVATGSVLSRQTAFEPVSARAVVQACIEACRVCAEECERHAAHMEHCRICAEVCRSCERVCTEVLAQLT